jgi:hypothetical protein
MLKQKEFNVKELFMQHVYKAQLFLQVESIHTRATVVFNIKI